MAYDLQTIKKMVTNLYHNVLGREPDATGFNGWVDLINRGIYTVEQVRQMFYNSAEYKNKTNPVIQNAVSNAISTITPPIVQVAIPVNQNPAPATVGANLTDCQQYVRDLYIEILKRQPDASGFENWVNQLATGMITKEKMREVFLNSTEYQEILAKTQPSNPMQPQGKSKIWIILIVVFVVGLGVYLIFRKRG